MDSPTLGKLLSEKVPAIKPANSDEPKFTPPMSAMASISSVLWCIARLLPFSWMCVPTSIYAAGPHIHRAIEMAPPSILPRTSCLIPFHQPGFLIPISVSFCQLPHPPRSGDVLGCPSLAYLCLLHALILELPSTLAFSAVLTHSPWALTLQI